MWAFGILVYWMLSGRTPFEAATISNIFVNIETGRWSFRGDCWNGVSEEAKVCACTMLTSHVASMAAHAVSTGIALHPIAALLVVERL